MTRDGLTYLERWERRLLASHATGGMPTDDPVYEEMRRFLDLMLGRRTDLTEISIETGNYKGPARERKLAAASDVDAAVGWILDDMHGRAAEIPVYTFGHKQAAAAVKVTDEAITKLALCRFPPSLAVLHGRERVDAVWLLSPPEERWIASANLSHAIARRLDGRPLTRIPVPGRPQRPWSDAPPTLRVVTGAYHDPEALTSMVRKVKADDHEGRSASSLGSLRQRNVSR